MNREREQIRAMEQIISNDVTTFRILKEKIEGAIKTRTDKGWRVDREYYDMMDYVLSAELYIEKKHGDFMAKCPPDGGKTRLEWFL